MNSYISLFIINLLPSGIFNYMVTGELYRIQFNCFFSSSLTLFCFICFLLQLSVTLETFQDLSLPIPGKEDLAKLHSASHQTSLVKAGSCGEAYAPQGWIAFFMEYFKR